MVQVIGIEEIVEEKLQATQDRMLGLEAELAVLQTELQREKASFMFDMEAIKDNVQDEVLLRVGEKFAHITFDRLLPSVDKVNDFQHTLREVKRELNTTNERLTALENRMQPLERPRANPAVELKALLNRLGNQIPRDGWSLIFSVLLILSALVIIVGLGFFLAISALQHLPTAGPPPFR